MLLKLLLLLTFCLLAASVPDYNYIQNGADWTGICATGKEQSPIDLTSKTAELKDKFFVYLQFQPLTGHTLNKALDFEYNYQIEYQHSEAADILLAADISGKSYQYTAKTFHIHSPSEHTIDGVSYDLELHIKHEVNAIFINPPKRNAMVALLFKVGDSAEATFFDNWSPTKNPESTITNFNFSKAMEDIEFSKHVEFFYYQGSLTTPPCLETVQWYVIKHIFPIKYPQLATIKDTIKAHPQLPNGNNRNIQQLNGRNLMKRDVFSNVLYTSLLSLFGLAIALI